LLAPEELNSEILFQTPEPIRLRPELSEVARLLELLDLRTSDRWQTKSWYVYRGALGTSWKRSEAVYIISESNHIISPLKRSSRQIKHFKGWDRESETKAGQGTDDDIDKTKILMSPYWMR